MSAHFETSKMNVELPLPYAERYLASLPRNDAIAAFPTITFLASKHPGEVRVRYFDESTGARAMRTTRFYLEHLSPAEYHRVFTEVVRRNHLDIEHGSPAPPLNERAHLSTLVLDLDEGNHSVHDVTCIGRLMQNAFAQHFGLRTEFVVSMRFCEDGTSRYHLFFPSIVMADMAICAAVLRIVASVAHRFKFDMAPTNHRCIRVHGTNRDEGHSEPMGVYRFVVGYDAEFRRMTEEPPAHVYSVRPSEQALLWWMLTPPNQYGRPLTAVAADAYQPLPPLGAAELQRSVFEGATNDLRRASLLDLDRSGRWFLAEGVARCPTCRDNCLSVVLCRLAYSVVNGEDVCTAYRWIACKARPVVLRSIAAKQFAVVVAEDEAWPRRWASPRTERGDVRVLSSIMQLPLECVYEPGFVHVRADVDELGPIDAAMDRRFKLRVSPVQLAALWERYVGRDDGGVARLTESALTLTADQCRDANGRVRLALGVTRPVLAAGTHEIITVAAPCGAGKSYLAFAAIAEAAGKVLVVAPRKSLTRELAQRIDQYMRAHLRNKRVVHYADVAHGRRRQLDDECDVLVVTPESLPQFTMSESGYMFDAHTLVVDELCTVVKTLYDSATTLTVRSESERALFAAIAKSRLCIAMDRDIGPLEKMFVGAVLAAMPTMLWRPVAGDPRSGVVPRVHVHSIVLKDWVRLTAEVYESLAAMLVMMRVALDCGERVAVFTARAVDAYALTEMFATDYRTKLIAGPVGEDEKAAFAAQPDGVLGDADAQLWIYTTSANVGISVERHPFDHAFVVLGKHLTLRDALQAERRVRHLVGQAADERKFHLCLGDVSSALWPLYSMPTVGDAVAAEQCKVQSANWLRHNRARAAQFGLDGSVQLLEHVNTVMQIAVQAAARHECALQFAILHHWLEDAGVTVNYVLDENFPAEVIGDMCADLKQCRADGKAARDEADALDNVKDDAQTQRVKRARGAPIVPVEDGELSDLALASPVFVKWQKQFGVPCCRVWRGLLIDEPAAVREEVRESIGDGIDSNMPGGGAFAGSLLARACLAQINALCVIEGNTPQFEFTPTPVLSPFDGRTMITADEFFEQLERAGSPRKSTQALFAGSSKMLRNVAAFRDTALANDDAEQDEFEAALNKRNENRFKHCKKLAAALLGGKTVWTEPRRAIWCAVNWLRNNGVECAIDVGDAWRLETEDNDE